MDVPRRLDVMTLNVWALPWPFARDRGRRFARIARYFAERNHDLVAIQEAWWPLGRVAIPGLRFGGGWPDSGLALGGRLAGSARLDLQRFAESSGTDRLAGKGLLRARIGDLLVGVTHLQASDDAVDVRSRQLDELVGWVTGDQPTILLGDFNFGPDDGPNEAKLAAAGFRDVGTGPTWIRQNPFTGRTGQARLDRILLRGPWSVVRTRVLKAIWSDHQPVQAVLTLP